MLTLQRSVRFGQVANRAGLMLLTMLVCMIATVCQSTHAQAADRFERGVFTVTPGKWVDVSALTLTNGKPAPTRTTARLQWTDAALRVQFDCDDVAVQAKLEGRDEPRLWQDDCVEVFLDMGHAHDLDGDWVHLLVTASGQVMDQRGPVGSYFTSGEPGNGQLAFNIDGLTIKTARREKGWTAEIAIPWKSIGGAPEAGAIWGFNLGRENQPDEEYQTLFATRGPFFRIERWGHLAFVAADADMGAVSAQIDAEHANIIKAANDARLLRERFEAHRYMPGQTWVELDNVIYGAKPDVRGPIGGGKGFTDVVTAGDYTVRNLASLIEALAKAKAGEVIFIPGDVEIDVSDMIYTEKLVLKIPAGVTLASDRGVNGSDGAVILSDTFQTSPMISTEGDDVTIKGLRLRGPDTKIRNEHHDRAYTANAEGRDQNYYYKLPTSDGVATDHNRLKIVNCEISGWSHGGVYFRRGKDQLVTHSYLHHNRRQGLGYGVAMDIAEVIVEYSLFDHNRHDIAATGRPGSGYIARHNVVGYHEAMSHHFDMHGGEDRKDGTTIAGDYIHVYNNTFYGSGRPVAIRGAAQKEELIHHNFFPRHRPPATSGDLKKYEGGASVRSRGKPEIHDNVYLIAHIE